VADTGEAGVDDEAVDGGEGEGVGWATDAQAAANDGAWSKDCAARVMDMAGVADDSGRADSGWRELKWLNAGWAC